jgi:predicted alpha/beta-fold hydrolase
MRADTPDPGATAETPPFVPPRWLAHPHLQSILPSLPPRPARVRRHAAALLSAARDVLLDCGDGVRLLAHWSAHDPTRPAARVAILIHGWEGSAESLYMLSAGQALFAAGTDVVRLNLRDHGPTHGLNSDLFHSCRLAEVIGAVQAIAGRAASARIGLAGFSLGGNFALRVAAAAPARGLELERVVAVCPVLDPARTLGALERGLPLYRRYFVRKWRRSLRAKARAWPGRYDFRPLLGIASLTEMTRQLVESFTEYRTLDDYLRGYAVVGDRLAAVTAPTRLVVALDDPICPAQDLARVARNDAIGVIAIPRGGHCGFLEDLGPSPWVDRLLVRELQAG